MFTVPRVQQRIGAVEQIVAALSRPIETMLLLVPAVCAALLASLMVKCFCCLFWNTILLASSYEKSSAEDMRERSALPLLMRALTELGGRSSPDPTLRHFRSVVSDHDPIIDRDHVGRAVVDLRRAREEGRKAWSPSTIRGEIASIWLVNENAPQG